MAEVNHKDRSHSEIGASSAHRWINCPKSVSLSRGIEGTTSIYAEEGTCAHELAEHCIELEVDPRECTELEFNGVKVTEDMAEYIAQYLERIMPYVEDEQYDTYVEEKFELKSIHEDMFGSNDFCAFSEDKKEMVIIDLKYGKGHDVAVEENWQLIVYALGAYEQFNDIYNFETVKMVVSQPRIEGSLWKEWEVSVDELLEYKDKLKKAVKEVYAKDPKASPGDHCFFCKAKHKCDALKKKSEEVVNYEFDSTPIEEEPKLPDVESLTKEQIIKVLTYEDLIKDWMKAVGTHAYELLENGEELEGFKLVKRRTQRKIRDEQEFIETFEEQFGEDLYQTKLQTLGKLEKLIGKKELADYLVKPDKGNQIAPVTDKRPEVVCRKEKVEDKFNNEPLTDISNYDDMEF